MQDLDDDARKLRSLFDASVVITPIADEGSATTVLATYASLEHASDRLFELLVTVETTGYTVGTVRALENHFFLSDVLDGSSRSLAETLSNIVACIPGVVQPDGQKIPSRPIRPGDPALQQVAAFVKSFDHSNAWHEAILIGRAFSALSRFPCSNARTKAVAEAATRLKQLGYIFTIESGRFQFKRSDMENIVAEIEKSLAQLGGHSALLNIMSIAGANYHYAYEQFLFGRVYAGGLGERPPTIPIGLLYNIAVKLPLRPPIVSNPSAAWDKALAVARDFTAILDLEPYSQFAFLNTDAPRLESGLRQVAHYDHCFSIRQWHLSFTPEFLALFFGDSFDADLKRRLGWSVADAVRLAQILNDLATPTPRIVPVETLVMAGMDRQVVFSMLPHFAHEEREANRNYRSPFDAAGPDVIFKPLIVFNRQFLFLLTASVLDPALFEATFAALKSISTDQAISNLRGAGTERLTKHVFAKYGFKPTFENAKYELRQLGAGECDLVFEDEQNIVFVECKAKAVTRAAMTGTQGEALLDFAGGLFESQAQALRHERILRSVDSILFVDGRHLEFRNRRILRLTVTLADHGGLQDRWMLRNVYNALLSAQVSCPANYAKKKRVDDLNENLGLFQQETQLLEACGQNINSHPLNAASASIPQLDIILNGAQSLTDVRTRLSFPTTFSTFNVLLEHFQMEKARAQAQLPPSPLSADR
jgi:Holliday junction resolvase-like predicted endonuclease